MLALAVATLPILSLTPNIQAAPQLQPNPQDQRVMVATRLQPGESIDLDGDLSEPIWARAEPAADFLQIDPDNGEPASERTEVYIVYDESRMYIGVICYDSQPEELQGNTMQRDASLSADDRFMWVFDTYRDQRTGYLFEINPSGAMGDSLVGNERGGRAWDGIWTARVRQTEIGWVAEIEMPFRTLNFDPSGGSWGVNFQRTVRRKNEESTWNPFARNQSLESLSDLGVVAGISEINQGVGLDVRPYLAGSALYDSRVADPDTRTSYTGDAGIDLIYNLTPGLRANFTVNTDFAETEVDDRQVNLTRFPIRFPEKRAFFLEGSNYFNMEGYTDAFFSRRIGLNEGVPQRIDFGAKLTGQIEAYEVGFLQVRTGEEGSLRGEDFTVFRGRRQFLSESHVGVLYTRRSVRQDRVTDPSVPLTPGLHTLGFDFRLSTRRFQGNKNINYSGTYIHTTNPEGTGNSVRYGMGLRYPNDLINAAFRINELQANYNPAVGFVLRRGIKQQIATFLVRPRPQNHPWIRQFSFGVNLDQMTDTKNQLLSRDIDFTLFQMNLHSGDSLRFGLAPQYERLQRPFSQPGGTNVVLPAGREYHFNRYTVRWQMSERRAIAFSANYSWGGYYSGTRREFGPIAAIRPLNGLLVNIQGQFNRIELAEGSFSTSLVQTDINSQFSPWLSLSSNLQYDTVSRIIGWQARFRWIPKPGNDVFFVYTHNWRDEAGDIVTLDRWAASKIVYTHRF